MKIKPIGIRKDKSWILPIFIIITFSVIVAAIVFWLFYGNEFRYEYLLKNGVEVEAILSAMIMIMQTALTTVLLIQVQVGIILGSAFTTAEDIAVYQDILERKKWFRNTLATNLQLRLILTVVLWLINPNRKFILTDSITKNF